MNTLRTCLAIALSSTLLVACGGDADKQAEEAGIRIDKDLNISADRADDLVKGITDAVNQLNENVEVVSARDMKALMPEEISGMTRTAYNASKKGVEGFSFSISSATFEEDDGPGVLNLSVTDIGKMRGFAQFGLDWLELDIDEENQDGFQRTGTYKGYKSFESSTNTRSGANSDMTVFIGDRLVLRAEASDLEWDVVQDVVDAIPVKKLEALIK